MRASALVPLLACIALSGAACDNSGDETPPQSTFAAEDEFARRITGRVLQGNEAVPGALVQVDPSPGLGTDGMLDPNPAARAAATDAEGRFRVQFAPLRYDLFVRAGRDVSVIRGVTTRGFDPQLGGDPAISGYRARIVPTPDRPPAPGNALAFFVSGGDARTASAPGGASDGSVEVVFRRFDATITMHVVEYVASAGLASAVAAGSADVRVRAGTFGAVIVPMVPVPGSSEVIFDASPPRGYTLAPIEVLVDYGLSTSMAVAARVAPGVPVRLAHLGVRYSARVTAEGDGASSDSGRLVFDVFSGRVPLALPPPVSAEAPIDDRSTRPAAIATLGVGDVLAARLGSGVIEHALQPIAGDGAVIRIATTARSTTLPDVTRLGLSQPAGRYLWTIEHFPELATTDKLTGETARSYTPSSRSVSRVVELR